MRLNRGMIAGLFFTLCILSGSFSDAGAQTRFRHWGFGGQIGAMNYLGDLDDDKPWLSTKPAVGVFLKYAIVPYFNFRFQYLHGYISGTDIHSTDAWRRTRALSFRSPIDELSFITEYQIFQRNYPFSRRYSVRPFLFGGVAVFRFNPQAQFNGKWMDLQPLGTEGQFLPGAYPEPYNRIQVAIPFGGGFHFKLSNSLDMSVEAGFRKSFTDYLDDVSNTYPDLQVLLEEKGPIAYSLSDPSARDLWSDKPRGNPNRDDWYSFVGISITYLMDFNRSRCYKF